MRILHYLTEHGIDPFQRWFDSLKDLRARDAVLRRLNRVQAGNFGDHSPCRGGVSELRIAAGPGYRIYYALLGSNVLLLLAGGSKRTQTADINGAVRRLEDYLTRSQ